MNEDILIKALEWAKKKGFKEVMAETEGYETPVEIQRPNEEIGIKPHITGLMNGNKTYIEVVSKDEEKQTTISKWKLLSFLAGRKGGHLYLMAPRGTKRFAETILKDYSLSNTRIVNI